VSTFRPYKFLVVAVHQILDEEGNVVGEAQADPETLFSLDQLAAWVEDYPDRPVRARSTSGEPVPVQPPPSPRVPSSP